MAPADPAHKHKFFLVIPPGFEKLAMQELEWRGFAHAPVTTVKGGLEFECELAEGLTLNLLSRIGTRVLLRLADFRCRDFPKLFKRVRELPWVDYIRGDFAVEVSAQRSRLMNKKRIVETVSEAVAKNLGKKASSSSVDKVGAAPTDIYVRFADDVVQISLDTTGEALFKRGYKTLEALAPLRENLAAGLFFALYEKAGRPSRWQLIDPLCGSGTFLTEAGLFFGSESRREFDFLKWVDGKKFSTMVNKISTSMQSSGLFGFDRHPDAVKAATDNARAAGVKAFFETKDFLKDSDIVSVLPPFGKSETRLGITNPPYGVRIQLPAPAAEFYNRLIGTFEAMNCATFGIIVPRQHFKHLPKPPERLDFSNGGIDVSFLIYS